MHDLNRGDSNGFSPPGNYNELHNIRYMPKRKYLLLDSCTQITLQLSMTMQAYTYNPDQIHSITIKV